MVESRKETSTPDWSPVNCTLMSRGLGGEVWVLGRGQMVGVTVDGANLTVLSPSLPSRPPVCLKLWLGPYACLDHTPPLGLRCVSQLQRRTVVRGTEALAALFLPFQLSREAWRPAWGGGIPQQQLEDSSSFRLPVSSLVRWGSASSGGKWPLPQFRAHRCRLPLPLLGRHSND